MTLRPGEVAQTLRPPLRTKLSTMTARTMAAMMMRMVYSMVLVVPRPTSARPL